MVRTKRKSQKESDEQRRVWYRKMIGEVFFQNGTLGLVLALDIVVP
jgi:hypothetical protein